MTTTQQKHVPALRFPEFSGEWKSLTLLELSISGFSNGVFNNPLSVGHGYKLINVKDMYKRDQIELSTLTLLDIPLKEFEKNKVVYGDVFFTRSSLVKEGIAHSNVFLNEDEDVTYDGHLIKMSPNRDVIKSIFLSYTLKTNSARKQLISRGKTTTMTTIGQEDIASVSIALSSLKEQQKIATFLSSIDTIIEQLNKKIALWEQYKKGMMQKLFSQEIRFKDEQGEDYLEWEKIRAIQIFASHTNKKHNSDLPILSATQGRGVIPRNETGLEIQSSARSIASYKVIEPGDFVISLRSFQGGIEYSRYLGIGSPAYTVLKPVVAIIGDFFRFYFKKEDFISKLNNTIIGIRDGKQIPYGDFSAMKLSVPSLVEQQKISNFLSAIDQKIELVATELNQAQTFKKGLLQQMFI